MPNPVRSESQGLQYNSLSPETSSSGRLQGESHGQLTSGSASIHRQNAFENLRTVRQQTLVLYLAKVMRGTSVQS